MTDASKSRSDDAEDGVARLMRAAGRRVEPPVAAYERALAAATAAWRAKVRRRKQARAAATIAASVLIAVATVPFLRNEPQVPVAILAGRADRIVGTLESRAGDGPWTMVATADDLHASRQLRTSSGSLAGVLLADGSSLRLAEATSLVLESKSRIRLLNGKIYLDTGAAPHSGQLEVLTAAGTAIDIGTQFEVQYRDDAYRLRVREGRVRLSRDSRVIESRSGQQVTIDAGGSIELAQMRADAEDWQWAQAIAPAPDIDGRPLSVLLDWVARETRKPIRFEPPELERRVHTTILHGNIRLLAPLDALSVMLATTDLEHLLVDDGTILIRLKTPD